MIRRPFKRFQININQSCFGNLSKPFRCPEFGLAFVFSGVQRSAVPSRLERPLGRFWFPVVRSVLRNGFSSELAFEGFRASVGAFLASRFLSLSYCRFRILWFSCIGWALLWFPVFVGDLPVNENLAKNNVVHFLAKFRPTSSLKKMSGTQRLHEFPSFWNGLPSRVVSEAPLAARKAFEVKSCLVPFSWLERPLGRRFRFNRLSAWCSSIRNSVSFI